MDNKGRVLRSEPEQKAAWTKGTEGRKKGYRAKDRAGRKDAKPRMGQEGRVQRTGWGRKVHY